MQDNKNFILAIVLSIAVLLGWQYFVAGPQIEDARQAQTQQPAPESGTPSPSGTSEPGAPGAPAAPAGAGAPSGPAQAAATATREEALARSARVPVDTGRVTGSINLTGGRIDDLRLDDYHVTTDDRSPSIVLLSPSGGPDGYFAEFGWVAPANGPAVPGASTVWTAPDGARLTAESPVTLTWDNGAGLIFRRTVALDREYMFTVTDAVENSTGQPVTLYPYGRIARLGTGHSAGWYILHEGPLGVFGDTGLREVDYDEVQEAREIAIPETTRGWLGITDKYWATALIPDQARPFSGRFTFSEGATPVNQADFRGEGVTVAPGASGEATSRLFAGAKQVAVVDGYQDQLGIERFELLIDWGWFYFITKPLFYVMDWFFRLFGNFGVAILLVTVIVKALFFPLANKSYKSMSAMKKLQPQMMALRERYKDDRVKQQQALMEMYKKEKINPVAGCWPILIQIPVFFALYKVLFVTIEMRHAPFFGWIQDLAAPDPTSIFNLFGLIPWDPPSFLMIGVWPIIMGITMWVQMRLNPAPPDPAQQMIFNWMPVVFTFMLASFPAGLVIYWAWNNTLSVLQQTVIMRRQGVPIDLLGNIRNSFRRNKPDKADAKS